MPGVHANAHAVDPADVLVQVFGPLADHARLAGALCLAEQPAGPAAVLALDDLNCGQFLVHTFDRTRVRLRWSSRRRASERWAKAPVTVRLGERLRAWLDRGRSGSATTGQRRSRRRRSTERSSVRRCWWPPREPTH